MRAVDTNVIVRFLAGDDVDQSAKAREVIAAGDVFVGVTVLVEVAWVLRRAYRFSPGRVRGALSAFLRLPGVVAERPEAVHQALEWTEAGLDFADALHLASAGGCEAFVTFDKDFARLGEGLSDIRMQLL